MMGGGGGGGGGDGRELGGGGGGEGKGEGGGGGGSGGKGGGGGEGFMFAYGHSMNGRMCRPFSQAVTTRISNLASAPMSSSPRRYVHATPSCARRLARL